MRRSESPCRYNLKRDALEQAEASIAKRRRTTDEEEKDLEEDFEEENYQSSSDETEEQGTMTPDPEFTPLALRSLQPLAESYFEREEVLAITEHVMVWRSLHCVRDDFPAASLRLLSSPSSAFSYFITPIIPIPTHYATCVLPLHETSDLLLPSMSAAFASPTELFIVFRSRDELVRVTSSSVLFDGDVNTEVCFRFEHFLLSPQVFSITFDDEVGPDDTKLFFFVCEQWKTGRAAKRFVYRLSVGREGGAVAELLDYVFNEREEPPEEISPIASLIAQALRRDVFIDDDLYTLEEDEWRSRPIAFPLEEWTAPSTDNTRVFEPFQLRTQVSLQSASVSTLLVAPNGGVSVVKGYRNNGTNASVTSSRNGRVILRVGINIYTGFTGAAVPSLLELARGAFYSLLSEQQQWKLLRLQAFDFQSFTNFCLHPF